MAAPPKPHTAAGSIRQQAKANHSGQGQVAVGASKHAAGNTGSRRERGIYVYGIAPADVELAAEVPGVGDPPGQVRVIRRGQVAALVSEVTLPARLGAGQERGMQQATEDLARDWEGRVKLWPLGPMAPYDFAGSAQPQG